jgi:DNA-directed RNA polymerase specialized sigma subunit
MSYLDSYRYDEHFKEFATSLEQALRAYPKCKRSELLVNQKNQMEELVELEDNWKQLLLKTDYWESVYEKFWEYIMDVKHNIAISRVFFRERQSTFSEFISYGFVNKDFNRLSQYHFNYQFISFAEKHGLIKDHEILTLGNRIKVLRNKIIELNLPLAISRAKMFWSKTPEFHLSHMDLIQIASEGLISAIDKFCLPFSRVFRAVCIGRMSGSLISNYSETLIHFYPEDKKKLYRANKLVHKYSIVPNKSIDFEGLSNEINEKYSDSPTTPEEICELLSSCASQFVELADKVMDDKKPKNIDNKTMPDGKIKYSVISIDENQQPETIVERELMHDSIKKAAQQALTLLERKILMLYGIDA